MIWESHYWKDDLLKQAASLRKRIGQKRWPDASLARCEQTIMLGAYSIRKLIESRKLTDAVCKISLKAFQYPPTGRAVTFTNHHRLEVLYGLNEEKKTSIGLRSFCDQLIHSYVFALWFEDSFTGRFLSSDRDRNKQLLAVPIMEIINSFEAVGNDDVVNMRAEFDAKSGDYVVKNS